MKKWWSFLLIISVAFFVFGCTEKPMLSDIQVAACNSAHDNDNCDKLGDLGLVTKSDCCSALGKCCANLLTGRVVSSSTSSLSDIQVAACESAAGADGCGKLVNLGIVTENECCSELGLCCIHVSVEEFKEVLIQAIKDYFSGTSVLSVDELKDLIVVYFSTSGDYVDLSGIGQYSGEDLVDIYGKAKGGSQDETCFDGIKDQDERGVDCGGVCESIDNCCSNSIKDGGEEGVDCGGSCPACFDQTYCGQDSDCACGKHKVTGACFYGNRAYVNTLAQCPDFCSGIAGNLVIRCIANQCTQVDKGSITTCLDSDGGLNYYKKGTVTVGSVSKTDECAYCTGLCTTGSACSSTCGAVKEYYCSAKAIADKTFVCPSGYTCEEGACVRETVTDCRWCGTSCMPYNPNVACIAVAPPAGYDCKYVNGKCTAVPKAAV